MSTPSASDDVEMCTATSVVDKGAVGRPSSGRVPAVRPARVPAQLRVGPFRGSEAVRAGLLTPRQLDGPAWRRLFRDVHVHREVPVTHQLRAVAAASLLLPGATVTGRSAAVLW